MMARQTACFVLRATFVTAGLIDDLLHVAMRGGKSAGSQSRPQMCRGDIVVILDIDTTLDRDALESLVPYFSDPRVGGVGGDLGVANGGASVVTRLPADRISHLDLVWAAGSAICWAC